MYSLLKICCPKDQFQEVLLSNETTMPNKDKKQGKQNEGKKQQNLIVCIHQRQTDRQTKCGINNLIV